MDEAQRAPEPREPESGVPGTGESGKRGPERRSLAAIVFTDVVSFSRHAADDEAQTYAAMHRDFALFTRLCEERGGRVANTAGDSMLMIFGSAVDAMECAMGIQAEIHSQARHVSAGGVLEHRIGVHIGDVIHDGSNVFGDGVNVASRIQEICRPGAIAYSRAVSEIVAGKIEARGIYLGPRRAKNIGEVIPVWEIPPIRDPERERLNAALNPPITNPTESEGITGGRGVVLVALAGVLLAAGFAIMATVRMTDPPRQKIRPTVVQNGSTPQIAPPKQPEGDSTNNPAGNIPTGATTEDLVTRTEETRRLIEGMKSRYDFDGIIVLLERARDEPVARGLGPATLGPALEHYRLLSSLKIWTDSEVGAIPVASPLDLGDGSVIDTSSGAPTIRGNDRPGTPLVVWNLSPSRILSLMTALDARPDRGSPPPAGGIEEFAQEYALTTSIPTN